MIYKIKQTIDNFVWFRPHRHIADYIMFEESDLFNNYKKITKKSKPILNIGAGFDCETSKKSTTETISHVYIWQFTIGRITFLCRRYTDFKRFCIELSELVKNIHPNASISIFDANISYEYSYFVNLLRDIITDVFAKSNTSICTFTVLNNLQFRECLGVFGRSLENIAKTHTATQKMTGDIDHTLIRTEHTHLSKRELRYCINDTVILSELWAVAFNMFISKGKKIPLTQTGIVRQEVYESFVPTWVKRKKAIASVQALIHSESQYLEFRKYLFSGGLTHSNFAYVGHRLDSTNGYHIACADLTSAYPWALNAKSYPCGQLIKSDDLKQVFNHKHWIIKVRLKNLESKSTHSTISLHKCIAIQNEVVDNGRIYRADSITVLLTEIDYQNVKAIYNFAVGEIMEAYYFTDSKYLPQSILKVMNTWYIKKSQLKPQSKKNSEVKKEYDRLKQLINAVYGMFVTQVYTSTWKWSENELINESANFDDNIPVFNPFVGYYCTAYVRQRLIDCISKYPDSIVQYDTDSIYWDVNNVELSDYIDTVNNKIYNEILPRCNAEELHDLGQWDKTDGDYPAGFMALGSKRYIGTHADGTHKITFAGANDTDIISESKRLNIDIYDYLKSFDITKDFTTKKGAVHSKDKRYEYDCTDRNGNTYKCISLGYTTIVNVTFKANLSNNFKTLCDTYHKAFC